MAYSDNEINRILELKEKLDENYESFHGPTYRDIPALKEITDIIGTHDEEDALEDNFAMIGFLADAYYSMGRHGVASRLYDKAFGFAERLGSEVFEDEGSAETLRSDIYYAAVTRNIYNGSKNSCEDIIGKLSGLIPDEEIRTQIEEATGSAKGHAKHDPVEDTEAYLAVIDDIEKKIDDELGSDMYRGKCHAIWSLKKELLKKHGISWRSLMDINGGIWD